MAWFLRDNREAVESEELDSEKIEALGDDTRKRIMDILMEERSYPAEIAKELGISKQKAYYHFKKLKESGLVQEKGQEKKSGGIATFYTPSAGALHLDMGGEGKKTGFEPIEDEAEQFLSPLVEEGELKGSIVVGSPDEHGPDQVRARDGHLAGEICLKLGNYVGANVPAVKWDTEVFREESFDQNLLLVGGVLTNTVTRKFNEEFPARFEGETFPYRKLETEKNSYSDPKIGVVARTENPEDGDKSLVLVAGVRNEGTEAAVKAFKNMEELLDTGDTYLVVEGRDMDGDGKIDDYKLREKG